MIAPDSTDTPMARAMATTLSPDDIEAGLKIMSDRIPRKQMGKPEDIATVAVFLLLDAPEHLSGQVIGVDGARSAG
jgi:NAD(P)-dependent dehydrogenase (short-subunit alcohol dehydrogenase family)